MMKLTVVTLVAVGCLIESAEPCTDDIVKQMAVSVCGLSKRSINGDNGWSIFGPLGRIFRLNFGRISDIQREYRKLIGEFDEAELLLKVSDRRKTKDNDDGGHSSVRKRDIMTLVKECCYRKCTVDDFKGICDKK